MLIKIVSIIFVLALSFFCPTCAGKTILPEVKSIRYIPKDKKTIYIATVYNYTTSTDLGLDIKEQLIDFFLNSDEVSYEPSLKTSDLFLEVEVSDFITNELDRLSSQNSREIRYLINLKASIKDVKTKKIYLDGVEFQASHLQKIDSYQIAPYNEDVKQKLFVKVAKNIEHLIRTGNVLINSKFGYEGLEEPQRTWLDKTTQSLGINKSLDTYGKPFEPTQENNDETNRLKEIDRRDREGLNRY